MKVLGNVYFVENPFSRPGYFTSTTIILGETITLIDVGTQQSAEESIFPYLKKLERRPEDISLIILTHGHSDHCGSAAKIARLTNAKIACHRLDVPFVEDPKRQSELLHKRFPNQFSPAQAEPFEGTKVDKLLDDGSRINIDDRELEVIHTPGHSAGSICLIDRMNGLAFSGDSIQGRGERRPLLFHSHREYLNSMKRMQGENVTTLLTGHPFPPINQGIVRGAQVKLLLQESVSASQQLEQRVENLLTDSEQGLTIAQILEMIPGSQPSTIGCLLEDMVKMGNAILDGKNYRWRRLCT